MDRLLVGCCTLTQVRCRYLGLFINQLAIYKCGRGFELGAIKKQIQVVVRVALEPGTAGLRVIHANYSATLPHVFVCG